MFSPLPSTLRLRTRSFLACLLAISGVVLILRAGYFRAVATGFIAAAHPRVSNSAAQAGLDRAAVTMQEKSWLAKSFVYNDGFDQGSNPERDANQKDAAAMRAAYDARNQEENNPGSASSIRARQAAVWGAEREGKAIPWGDLGPDSEKRGVVLSPYLPFLPWSGKSPGAKPNLFDGIFDPNIAFDARYQQTPEMQAALKTRKEFAARNPLDGYKLDAEDQRNAQAIPFLKPNPEFDS